MPKLSLVPPIYTPPYLTTVYHLGSDCRLVRVTLVSVSYKEKKYNKQYKQVVEYVDTLTRRRIAKGL